MQKIYGIVGHPVSQSLSPAMHNAAIKELGLEAEYKLIDIDPTDPEELANFCYELDMNNIGGFSVTMPFKEEVMGYMDHYDPLCKMIGAANTVLNEDGKLIGYNTDATGAMQALQETTGLAHKKALVMGAGGTARAIIYSLKEFEVEVYIFNRNMNKAEELADQWDLETIETKDIPKAEFDLIINATPVGMLPETEASLLHAEDIPATAVVMDVIVNPIETQLLKEAKKAGATTISGERMLLFQAADQFKIWFGKEAPLEVMEKALYEGLKKRK